MKRIVSFITVFLFLLIASVSPTFAQEKNIIVKNGETVTQNPYFAAGDNVTISGTIPGDAYVGGGNVIIDGTINGDLIVAGGTVKITGEVKNDVRGAAGQFIIDGMIGGSVTLASGNLDISKDSTIGGSLVAAAGNLYIASPIGADARVAGGSITLLSQISGDLLASSENITLGPDSLVEGNLTYWSDNDINLQEGAGVSGEITKNKIDTKNIPSSKDYKEEAAKGALGAKVAGAIIGAITTFIVGLLLLRFYPNYTQRVVKTITDKPWKSFGYGFLFLIVSPLAFIILLLTVVGAPIGLIVLAGYFLFMYLSKIFVISWGGNKIASQKSDKIKLAVGIIIYYAITIIPFVGGITKFFVMLFGFGAIILSIKSTHKQALSKKVI
jgi:cytoskeletal protein CcmA (bactofilin family)